MHNNEKLYDDKRIYKKRKSQRKIKKEKIKNKSEKKFY